MDGTREKTEVETLKAQTYIYEARNKYKNDRVIALWGKFLSLVALSFNNVHRSIFSESFLTETSSFSLSYYMWVSTTTLAGSTSRPPIFPPFSISKVKMSKCPLSAATSIGVAPACVGLFASAPCASSVLTTL